MESAVLDQEVEVIDWARSPADAVVCPEKEILLRDVVQLILDGLETPEEIMTELNLTSEDSGVENIQPILDVFVPVINAWKSGSCGMGCAGCSGSCGG